MSLKAENRNQLLQTADIDSDAAKIQYTTCSGPTPDASHGHVRDYAIFDMTFHVGEIPPLKYLKICNKCPSLE